MIPAFFLLQSLVGIVLVGSGLNWLSDPAANTGRGTRSEDDCGEFPWSSGMKGCDSGVAVRIAIGLEAWDWFACLTSWRDKEWQIGSIAAMAAMVYAREAVKSDRFSTHKQGINNNMRGWSQSKSCLLNRSGPLQEWRLSITRAVFRAWKYRLQLNNSLQGLDWVLRSTPSDEQT